LLNQGAGTFVAQPNVPGGRSGFYIGDFNGDGRLDFVGLKATINATPVVAMNCWMSSCLPSEKVATVGGG
jgi:hypothetical protein